MPDEKWILLCWTRCSLRHSLRRVRSNARLYQTLAERETVEASRELYRLLADQQRGRAARKLGCLFSLRARIPADTDSLAARVWHRLLILGGPKVTMTWIDWRENRELTLIIAVARFVTWLTTPEARRATRLRTGKTEDAAMKRWIGFLSLLALFLLYSSVISVQSQQQVERVEIRRVRLPLTVVDKKGLPVIGLKSSDFLIFEDKKPQQIETFSDESGPGQSLYVGVLIDTSPSAIAKLKFEQEAAMNFLHSVLRPRKDRAALVTFDDEVTLRQDFTEKIDLLDRAVSNLKKPGRQTALYDAVWKFCEDKMRNAPGRRAVVVITDGDDTYSRASLRDVIEIAQQTETTVFAVSTKAGFAGTVPGVDAGQAPDGGDRALIRLGEETGGRAFFTGDLLELEQAFDKLAKELRAQYLVTYKPTNERYDGSFRRIEVKLADGRDGKKVRAKRGYVASAQTR